MFEEKSFLCVVLPRRGLCKAPPDPGVCWKQFMILLEEVMVYGGVSPARPGSTKGFASAGLPVYCLVSSVVGGSEVLVGSRSNSFSPLNLTRKLD